MARRQAPDDLLITLQQAFEQVAVSLGGIECSVQGYGPGFRNMRGADISKLVTSVSGYNYLKVKEIAQDLAEQISRHRRFSNISIDQASYGREPAWNVVAIPNRERMWNTREDVGAVFSYISGLTSIGKNSNAATRSNPPKRGVIDVWKVVFSFHVQ